MAGYVWRTGLQTINIEKRIWTIAACPDGKIACHIGCIGETNISVINPDEKEPKKDCKVFQDKECDLFPSLAVLPDGRFASRTNKESIKIWNPHDSEQNKIFLQSNVMKSSNISSISVLPDGSVISVGEYGFEVSDLKNQTSKLINHKTIRNANLGISLPNNTIALVNTRADVESIARSSGGYMFDRCNCAEHPQCAEDMQIHIVDTQGNIISSCSAPNISSLAALSADRSHGICWL